MGNKISHSKLVMFSDCGKKYENHYVKRLRSKTISSALLFGSAIDKGLNDLLANKDVEKAKQVFLGEFQHYRDNEENYCDTRLSPNVQWSKSDLDQELLPDEVHNLPVNEQSYLSLVRKGEIMIDSYAKDVLPRIVRVIAIQEPISLPNGEGDEIIGFLDIVAQLDDGNIYLLDHKTSAVGYEPDSAGKSQQLVTYHHEGKDKYGLNGVGFIVMAKKINKNRKKTCTKCGYDGSEGKHKTCPNELVDALLKDKRCNGEWEIQLNPTCSIDVILNKVQPATEDLIIETYDAANENIKAGKFAPNLSSCFKWGRPCEYYKLCHEGSMDGLVELGEKK